MQDGLFSLLGGIGLFLFGMHTMTAALRDLASGRVRHWLAGAATTPLRGAVTGALVTALIQSSTAVTVTLIGFVGAGLLTFSQSVGIIFGANIGTTITGWIVAVIGIKLKFAAMAPPLLFAAALLGAFGRGWVTRVGAAAAGFALIFLGLDAMQAATVGIEAMLNPETLPPDTWIGRGLLLLLGAGVVALIQSSSAGVAMTLVFYSAGAISLSQAAALVIGMDIGTTVTGLIAAMGGGRAMLRTAVAHVSYNVLTGGAAFLLLGWLVALAGLIFAPRDPAAVVAFHTAFNILGVALILPFSGPFARLIERMVPDRADILPEPLDRQLLGDPHAALDAACGATDRVARATFSAMSDALRPGRDGETLAALLPRLPASIDDLQGFLAAISVPDGHGQALARYTALLHQLDHLRRIGARAGQETRIARLASDPALRRPTCLIALALDRAARSPDAARLSRVHRAMLMRGARLRRMALLRERMTADRPADVFASTDAIRWLERVSSHAERIAHHGACATNRAVKAPAP